MPTLIAATPDVSIMPELAAAPLEMHVKFNIAAGRLAELALAGEDTDLPEAIRAIVNSLGIKHVTWLRFSVNTSDDVTLLSAIVTYSKTWQTRYFVRRYHTIDPIFAHARSAGQPFDWRDVPRRSAEVEAFFADARQHGLGANAITIPMRNRPDHLAVVSLTSDLIGPDWTMFKQDHMPNLLLLAVLIDHIAGKAARLPAHQAKLSRREEESLTWAARGKTTQEIADIMDVGYASVRAYLDMAKVKLGCVNVTHAAALAVAVGLIPPRALKGTDPKGFSAA